MARGFAEQKQHTESTAERKSKACNYYHYIKSYKQDTAKNTDARVRFRRPLYHMRDTQCQKKKDITE